MPVEDSEIATLVNELRDLLAAERQALLSGSPGMIGELAQRKLALAERIERGCAAPGAPLPPRETLVALDRYNRENSVICAAMLRHLTAALDRLRQTDLHRSYQPDGSEQNPPSSQSLGAA
jgi:flagellar biosynthesis/type III secretory pathway chaperone